MSFRLLSHLVRIAVFLAALLAGRAAAQTTEFRGMWADVWHEGYKSAAQIDAMVARAVQGGYNAIFPELLAYQDSGSNAHGAYWNSAIVPKAADIQGGIDPLAYLIQQAHAQGIEVHAWLTTLRVSTSWPPANNATLAAHPEWIMVEQADMNTGPQVIGSDYTLDPGSPDVQEYLIDIVRELVANYELDGIHWDRIRYEQTDAGYPAYTSYARSGLARFKEITGYVGTPAPTGVPTWNDFRRRSITELVRRAQVEIESVTSNPRQPLRHSAALITWGDAPSNFASTNAYLLFQNWEEWQRLGYLDMAIPMTYYDEDSYPTWYRNWVNREISWSYDRHMVVGPALYLNEFDDSVTQMLYARNAGADGICTYAYALTRSGANYDWTWYPYVAANVFTSAASPPGMPWRSPYTATEGRVWGRVTDSFTGEPIDDAAVQVGALGTVRTDGNGYYVMTLVPASGSGTNYDVTVSQDDYTSQMLTVQVLAGQPVRQDFALDLAPIQTFIVESRAGGQNFDRFSQSGTWANSASKSSAAGTTAGIGSLYTYLGYADRVVTYSFTPTTTASYDVYVTWVTSANACSSAKHTVTHAGGTSTVYKNQLTGGDTWVLLGRYNFDAWTTYGVSQYSSGSSGGTIIRADAVKWQIVGPQPPTITLSPTTLSPSCVEGSNAAGQSFTVQNTGGSTLDYSISANQTWLSVTPASGSSTGEADTITVNYSTSALSAGTYNATITVSDPNATNNPQTIAVTLTVSPAITVFIVESRSGGQNYDRYSETGAWSNSTAKSTASGCTAGIGSRYCSISSTAKTAVFKFTPTTTGSYRIYTTNAGTTNSGNPLVHKVTHAGGTTNVNVCQNSTCNPNPCNQWRLLGTFTLNAGTEYKVTLDGSTGAGSAPAGNAGRADAIKWEKQ